MWAPMTVLVLPASPLGGELGDGAEGRTMIEFAIGVRWLRSTFPLLFGHPSQCGEAQCRDREGAR